MTCRREFLQVVTGGIAGTIVGLRGLPAAAATAADPVVTGPITGGRHGWPFAAHFGDIGALGYIEEEYFITGQATPFKPVGDLGLDGRWTVEPLPARPYKTRILVRRPRDPVKFNGAVLVEWTNVSAGRDSISDPTGLYEGYALVAVSTQKVGIDGYPINPMGLVQWDPERYGSLSIPGDSMSYDIFTQAAQLVGPNRKPQGPDPMGGLKVQKLIATGASQSGTRILTYINAIQPRENVFDALMPVICAGSAADFEDAMAHPDPAEGKTGLDRHSRHLLTFVRDDLSVPVMAINSETEALFYYPRRQPDSDRFVEWEVAGASHASAPMIAAGRAAAERDGVAGGGGLIPKNAQDHGSDVSWVPTVDAAVQHVHNWIHGGPPPPSQPKIAISGNPLVIARDEHGNALGGIRLPELEVPIARYSGVSPVLDILGETFPFTAEELKRLYPTHEIYVEKVKIAAIAAERAGVILPYRVKEYIETAQNAAIPA